MLHRLTVLLLAGALLAPVAASAQQNPFQNLPPAQGSQQTQAPQPRATREPEDDGLERWQELLIFGGGVLFIAGIGFAITHDARRRAPVDDERAYYRHKAADREPTKRKVDRKKTKAQKAARKKQRARR